MEEKSHSNEEIGGEETSQHPPKQTTKERFRRYLDKSGVSAAILRGIVTLFEEENKPNDPIRYLCQQWGFGLPENDEVDALQAGVINLRKYYAHLCRENERLHQLMVPKPNAAEELGLDDETHELLLKQAEQLAQIQHREACILKAYDEAKVKAVKDLKVPVCLPVATNEEETVQSEEIEAAIEDEEEAGGEGDKSGNPELTCSLDVLNDDVKPISQSESVTYEGDTTITIALEELKNQAPYTCGMTMQITPNF